MFCYQDYIFFIINLYQSINEFKNLDYGIMTDLVAINFKIFLWNIINIGFLSYFFNLHKRKYEINQLESKFKIFYIILLAPLYEELIFRLILLNPNFVSLIIYISFLINELYLNEKYLHLSKNFRTLIKITLFCNIVISLLFFCEQEKYKYYFFTLNSFTFGILHLYNHLNIDLLSLYLVLSSQFILGLVLGIISFNNGFIYSLFFHYFHNFLCFGLLSISFVLKANPNKSSVYLVDENGIVYI
jgi:hypothetical protein